MIRATILAAALATLAACAPQPYQPSYGMDPAISGLLIGTGIGLMTQPTYRQPTYSMCTQFGRTTNCVGY